MVRTIETDLETVSQAAKRASVHVSTLYELIHAGKLPAIKVAGRILLKSSDVDAYMTQRLSRQIQKQTRAS